VAGHSNFLPDCGDVFTISASAAEHWNGMFGHQGWSRNMGRRYTPGVHFIATDFGVQDAQPRVPTLISIDPLHG